MPKLVSEIVRTSYSQTRLLMTAFCFGFTEINVPVALYDRAFQSFRNSKIKRIFLSLGHIRSKCEPGVYDAYRFIPVKYLSLPLIDRLLTNQNAPLRPVPSRKNVWIQLQMFSFFSLPSFLPLFFFFLLLFMPMMPSRACCALEKETTAMQAISSLKRENS